MIKEILIEAQHEFRLVFGGDIDDVYEAQAVQAKQS